MPTLDSLIVEIEADAAPMRQGLRSAGDDVESFSEDSGRSFDDLARRTAQLAAVAAGALAAGFAAVARNAARSARDISQAARAAGIGTAEFIALSTTFQALGRDQQDATDAMIDLQDRIQELRDGTSSYVEDFALLNLAYRDFIGLDPSQALLRVSRAVSEAEDRTAALAAAARLLASEQRIVGDIADTYDRLNARLETTGALQTDLNIAGLNEDFAVFGQTIESAVLRGLSDLTAEGESLDQAFSNVAKAIEVSVAAAARLVNVLADIIVKADEFLSREPEVDTSVGGGSSFLAGGTAGAPRRNQFGDGLVPPPEVVTPDQVAGLRASVAEPVAEAVQTVADEIESAAVDPLAELQAHLEGLADGFQRGNVDEALRIFAGAAAPAEVVESAPDFERDDSQLRDIAHSFVTSLSFSIADAIQDGDWSSVGDALLGVLTQTFTQLAVERFAQSVVGGIFPSFHEGGVVPGPRGSDVPIVAQAGERIVSLAEQQAGSFGGAGSVSVTNVLPGDADASTRRAMLRNARDQGAITLRELAFSRAI